MIKRNPASVHEPLANYSHQIEVSPNARWLVMSGQLGQAPDLILSKDTIEQIEFALKNVEANLAEAHMGVNDIVKMTIYLVGETDTARRREVLKAWLGDHCPCMTLIHVVGLATPDHKAEIDVWACKATNAK